MSLDRNHFTESCNFTNENTEIRRIKGLVRIMQRVIDQILEFQDADLLLLNGDI